MHKLLQICVEGNRGSTGRLAESIGEEVMKNGWESFIAYGRFSRPSKSKLFQIGNYADILFHGLLTRIFDRHGLGSARATKKLIKFIQQVRPDVIHLHHLHGYYVNIEVLFNYLSNSNIPVIWTFHDCWSMTGHCTHFSHIDCDRWKSCCYKCPQKMEYPASFFADRSKMNFKLKKELFNSVKKLTIVSVSNWLDNIVSLSFLKNQNRKVIYNGINLDIFNYQVNDTITRSKYGIGKKFLILGVANPWTEKKGFFDFIKLSNKISYDTVVVLVGLSKKQILNLPDNIIGIEKTDNQKELRDLYSAANLFINFSVEETFGLTTAESLACGTPAVVYNKTACPEVIDYNTGFIIEQDDFNKVLDVIEIVKLNGKNYYQDKCRNRIIQFYNIKDKLVEYRQLYLNTLSL